MNEESGASPQDSGFISLLCLENEARCQNIVYSEAAMTGAFNGDQAPRNVG